MAQKPKFDYDTIIIGSGAAGSPAANILARTDQKVAVVEKSTFGGESPNWGDIPLGAISNAASAYTDAKFSSRYGLRTGTVGYNYPSLLSWKDTVIKRTGAGNSRSHYQKIGVSVFAGEAHFLSPNEITVNRRHLSAKRFLIATGSEWSQPNIAGLDETPHHTPKTIMSLTRPPKSLFIIGSGSTALEIAYIFAAFGTKVYISEAAQRILPDYDSEVGQLIAENTKSVRGMTHLTQTKVVSVQESGIQRRVTFVQGGHEHSVKVDQVMVAENRIPATDLGLENAGVRYDHRGVIVNDELQTTARHIFAAGSVVDTDLQTHEVLMHSRLAAQNLIRRSPLALDYGPKLRVIFTHPQIAQVGLSEDDCIKRDLRINTAITPLTLTARSNITDQRVGFVKLISDKKGVLIGGTIAAPNASEMISELAVAIRHKLTARQLMATPHCFVSWSEAIRITAGKLL